jgi:hypothetical protein
MEHHPLEDHTIATRTRPASHVGSDESVTVAYNLTIDRVALLSIKENFPIDRRALVQGYGSSIDKPNKTFKSFALHDIRNLLSSNLVRPD